MSNAAPVSSSRVEQALLIVFADLTRFMVNARSTPDAALADLLDAYYRHAEGLVSAAGGRVVKFMGDAFLAVWPEARAGSGAEARRSSSAISTHGGPRRAGTRAWS